MSSSAGKNRETDGERKLFDLLQPSDKPIISNDQSGQQSGDDSALDPLLPLQSSYGNAAVARKLIQRKAEGEETSETASSTSETQPVTTNTQAGGQPSQTIATSLIVEDTADVVGPGQMKKSQFLAELKLAICNTAAQALAGTPLSAVGCPYIERWFGHYAGQSSDYIEKAVRRYVPEVAGSTTAGAYIAAITARVSRAATTWATTGQITGVPPGVTIPPELLAMAGGMGSVTSAASSVAGAASAVASSVGTAASGIASGVSSVASGIAGGVSSAISGISNLLFKEHEGGAREGADPQAVQNRLGTGESLDAGVRIRMEEAFGESFSGVQVHTDTNAAHISENLNARALTVGNHIAFGQGEYKPGNPIGDALVAHELAHVLQQRGAGQTTQRNESGSSNTSGLEEAADQSAVAAIVSMLGGSKQRMGKIARSAMPRLRSGLKLSRCPKKSEPEPEPKPAPEPIPADPHAEYEKRLKEAIDILESARFGLCFESTTRYDTKYWYIEEDPLFGKKITLKSGKRPSDAIDAMFADLGKWSVDCAEFVQVAQWYALRHAYGADEFNKRAGLSFSLRSHFSTGIKYKETYLRTNKTSKMIRLSDKKEETKSVEDLLKDAPYGSRIMWTNKKAPTSSAFHNENTIKLGPDAFAAHGFSEATNIFTRAEIELKLARAENSSAGAAYVAENIFLSEIDYYDTP
jgi:hypothetical protein